MHSSLLEDKGCVLADGPVGSFVESKFTKSF